MPPVLSTERIAHLGTADCCIHPPGRNEMIAITPPKIFSKEVAQKQATPFPRQDLLTARNVSDQISGDGAWMNFRFSRALPTGGPPPTPALMRGIPFRWTLADHLFAYPATLACSAPPSKGWAMRCTVLGFTSNLAAVLRTLMPPARAALIRSASLSAIGGRPSRLPSRLARCKPARTRS